MNTSKTSYLQRKESILKTNSILELKVIPIDPVNNITEMKKRDFWPFSICICNQYNPDSPCSCDDKIVVWIPSKNITEISKTSIKNKSGDIINTIKVDKNTDIQVEILLPMMLKDFLQQDKKSCNCHEVDSHLHKRRPDWARACRDINPFDYEWGNLCECVFNTDNSLWKCIGQYFDDKKGI